MSTYAFTSLQVVSTCDKEGMEMIQERANKLGLAHSGLVHLPLNGNWFLCVYPTGSKTGWPQEEAHDDHLGQLIALCHERNEQMEDTYLHCVRLEMFEHDVIPWQNRISLSI